ncbi:long-chain acyl-CoA synthetase [Bradyrhizobium sp. i1.8.4]|uniref:AMP-binding protein n=1 Tax=unclassified Bradyrhizobium TaxID=2631580 RepID=UPI003D233534
MQNLLQRQTAAAAKGMSHSLWADLRGNKIAIHDPNGARTFRQVNEAANRIVRLLRERGLTEGDAVALLCSNRAEFVEVLSACFRGGYRLTPVNWHLNAREIEHIINDCDAKALFAETRFPAGFAAQVPAVTLKISIGGAWDGFECYEKVLEKFDSSDIIDPTLGSTMLYTSGTTGRPKGVYRRREWIRDEPLAQPDDVQMCAGPAYHGGPLVSDVRSAMVMGIPLVFLDRWDSENTLRTIEKHKVTRCHMVPIMFQRLLALPDAVKRKYDISSLRYILHGAAPCPPEVKKAMIDWVGPILNEYYAGSENGAGIHVSSEEWLKKPGTIGKLPYPGALRILDDQGAEVSRGQAGTLYFPVSLDAPFEYHKDPEKTASAHRDGYFTLGDVGYADEDGYVFLTGRTAECIISGGTNIYPQEIDNELIKHPAVQDVCTIGVPNVEWGEEVKSVVMLNPGFEPSDSLMKEIVVFARERLAGFKVPRSVEFVKELPRSAAGKVQRKKVREPYWAGRERQI